MFGISESASATAFIASIAVAARANTALAAGHHPAISSIPMSEPADMASMNMSSNASFNAASIVLAPTCLPIAAKVSALFSALQLIHTSRRHSIKLQHLRARLDTGFPVYTASYLSRAMRFALAGVARPRAACPIPSVPIVHVMSWYRVASISFSISR